MNYIVNYRKRKNGRNSYRNNYICSDDVLSELLANPDIYVRSAYAIKDNDPLLLDGSNT